jgi:hypothetical protein
MTEPNPKSPRKPFVRFGLIALAFTVICVALVAFSPPAPASALADKTPTATAGPSPTPEPPPYCGGFHVRVEFHGFRIVNGKPKPVFQVNFRDDRDADCDGVPDGWDNCPLVANKDQDPVEGEHYGAACIPESGFRLTGKASEVVVYQMDDGAFHLYSAEGEKLGELSRAGLVAINPTLVVQQVMGRTYLIGFTNAEGKFRSTQFQSNALTFSAMDIGVVAVGPAAAELKPGQSMQFFAKGYEPSGIDLWFMPRWNATGGSVSQSGVYTAGSLPGEYTVSACRLVTVCGTATVKILP